MSKRDPVKFKFDTSKYIKIPPLAKETKSETALGQALIKAAKEMVEAEDANAKAKANKKIIDMIKEHYPEFCCPVLNTEDKE